MFAILLIHHSTAPCLISSQIVCICVGTRNHRCRKIFFRVPRFSDKKCRLVFFWDATHSAALRATSFVKKQPLLLRNVSESYSYSSNFKALKIIFQEFLVNSIDLVTNQSVPCGTNSGLF